MSCGDLCTAAKCAELEGRIDELQQLIFELTGLVQEHRNLPVPYAHDIIPNFNVRNRLNGSELTTEVDIFGERQSSTVTLPDSVVPTVNVEVIPQDNYNHQIVVTVNESSDNAVLTTHQPQLEFGIEELGDNQYGFGIIFDGQPVGAILDLTEFVPEETLVLPPEFSIDVDYQLDLLTVAVTIDGQTKKDTVYIDANVINRFGGGGPSNDTGEEDVTCQQIADALQLELGEILAAIAAIQAQVTQVQNVITVEVEASTLTKFDCPEEDSSDGAKNNTARVKNYKLATLPALHKQLQYINENQLSMFERMCELEVVVAFPDWWQVRLGSNVPQIVCSFRKGNTSTYHSLSIPHPKNTEKPKERLLPSYKKGNWQGMVTCKDNSKFIINCVSAGEASVMCNAAISLIDPDFLESPPRVYIGERRGQAVGVDVMTPAVIQYFEKGQQNFAPDWRVRIAELDK